MSETDSDLACEIASGEAAAPEPAPGRRQVLIAVFDTPIARYLLRYAADTGYRPVLVEPDPSRIDLDGSPDLDGVLGLELLTSVPAYATALADVVVTDHDRDELGITLRDALASPARWIGVMGGMRHEPPHVKALALLGVEPDEIARVHRPIGLNIGSQTPAEIAISTLAGLIADRNDRPGGFSFG